MAFENVVIDEKNIGVGEQIKDVPADTILDNINLGDKPTEEKKPEFDRNAYIKETFGFDNEEVAKQEIENLKKKQDPIKFSNETSERFFNYLKDGKEDDVYNFLKAKRELGDVEKLEAKDAIKLNLQYQNKDYSPDEVDFLFEEKYIVPEKPEQTYDQTEEDYAKSISKWEKEVSKIEKRISIDSKVAKKELQKFNTDLVLPDIRNAQSEQYQQKALEVVDGIRKTFAEALDKEYKNFNGYSAVYKDNNIEIPVNYTITDEEKNSLKQDLADFDVEDYLTTRWFGKDGKPDIKRQMSDKYILDNYEKILAKVAQDAGAKVLEHYIRKQKNITIGQEVRSSTNGIDNRTDLQKLQEARWKRTG